MPEQMPPGQESPLAPSMRKYDKALYLPFFISDYLATRDECLQGREITLKNLGAVMPKIIEGLVLKLSQRVGNQNSNPN